MNKRQYRLAAYSLARLYWPQMSEQFRNAFGAMKRFLDNEGTREEVIDAVNKLSIYSPSDPFTNVDNTLCNAILQLVGTNGNLVNGFSWMYSYICWKYMDEEKTARFIFDRVHEDCIHDPIQIDGGVLTWNNRTIPRIAESIYRGERFDEVGILADALEDASCTDVNILDHLRNKKQHFHGCWVIDVIRRNQNEQPNLTAQRRCINHLC